MQKRLHQHDLPCKRRLSPQCSLGLGNLAMALVLLLASDSKLYCRLFKIFATRIFTHKKITREQLKP
jgi:hypothetical protein